MKKAATFLEIPKSLYRRFSLLCGVAIKYAEFNFEQVP